MTREDDWWSEAEPKVHEVWTMVMEIADGIFKAHLQFGFATIEKNINPTLEDILLRFRAIESMLDSLVDQLNGAEQRLVLNAKQQIINVHCISCALKEGNREDYDCYIARLGSQSKN